MGSDDFIELDSPKVSNDGGEYDGLHDANSLQVAAPEIQNGITNSGLERDSILNGELEHTEVDCKSEDDEQQQTMDRDGNVASCPNQKHLLEKVELTRAITVMNEITEVKSGPVSENAGIDKLNSDAVITDEIHGHYISGVKRARRTCDEQQPCVRVIFNFLTRSERKRISSL